MPWQKIIGVNHVELGNACLPYAWPPNVYLCDNLCDEFFLILFRDSYGLLVNEIGA